MRVIDIHGITLDALVGPEHGATRLFIWSAAAGRGETVGLHHHHGEELLRVLYGRLRFRAGNETREVRAGEVVIVPPRTDHAHRALEDSEFEIYGEIGMGQFSRVTEPDGAVREEEVFVRGRPWSRTPPDERQYITAEELYERYRVWSFES